MTEALNELRRRLEAEGWCQMGRGMQPWAFRYVRPCVDWPSDEGTSSRGDAQPPPLAEASRG